MNDDREQSSYTYLPQTMYQPSARFQSIPYEMQEHSSSDDRSASASASAASWNSVNANSQMSHWSSSLATISNYIVPWMEEQKKPSSWDENSMDESPNEGFTDEHSDLGKDDTVISKDTSKEQSGLCYFLTKQTNVPVIVVYPLYCLTISLIFMCFFIGYQSEKAVEEGNRTRSVNSFVLTPVAPPTPMIPTLGPTVAPTQSPSLPVTSQASQCSDNTLTVDKPCYIAGDDGILLEFNVCESRESDWIGIYPVSTVILMDDYVEWSWSCGTKLCSASPKMSDFVIVTERIFAEGQYRAYYMRYNNDGTPFAAVAMSETFEIGSRCADGLRS